MAEFFDFTIWFAGKFVGLLFGLPFMDGFSFGDVLVAVTLLAVVITALVSTITVANLSGEAHAANRSGSGKGGDAA